MLREMGSKKNQTGAELTRLIDGFASVLAAAMENSVEQFLRPGGDWEGEKRGYRGGRRGIYRRRVLMAIKRVE
jgi:hypothetical protein